jgi:hypothetical protein
LRADEELVITSISKVGRQLAEKQRNLQSGGVRIDFTVGVQDQARALQSKTALSNLSSGNESTLRNFSQQLDAELRVRGKAPVNLPLSSMAFAQPEQREVQVWQNNSPSGISPTGQQQQSSSMGVLPGASNSGSTTSTISQSSSDSSSSTVLLAMGGMALLSLLIFVAYNKGKSATGKTGGAHEQMPAPVDDAYASKVAAMDSDWIQQTPQEAQQDSW